MGLYMHRAIDKNGCISDHHGVHPYANDFANRFSYFRAGDSFQKNDSS